MQRFLLSALLGLMAMTMQAQYVSLNDAELGRLKELINTNGEVKQLYAVYQRTAQRAMDTLPHPIDTLGTEGKLQGDPKKAATREALRDMSKIYSLALVYRLGGDKRCLQKAIEYLTAWARVNRSKGDPIDDTNLDDAIEAYDLIKGSIDAANNQLITGWLQQVADAESNTLKKRPNATTSFNNWNSHRLKVIGEIAWATGNVPYQQFVTERLKIQLAKNLYADSTGFDFHERDALHYHAYDLEPLLKLAIVLKRATGTDYYNYTSETGSSIKKSTEWFAPFVTGEKTHGEFVHSKVRFDSLRAANHEAGYKAGTLFDPHNGYRTLALAAYFNPKFAGILDMLRHSRYGDWQLVLNSVRSRY